MNTNKTMSGKDKARAILAKLPNVLYDTTMKGIKLFPIKAQEPPSNMYETAIAVIVFKRQSFSQRSVEDQGEIIKRIYSDTDHENIEQFLKNNYLSAQYTN